MKAWKGFEIEYGNQLQASKMLVEVRTFSRAMEDSSLPVCGLVSLAATDPTPD